MLGGDWLRMRAAAVQPLWATWPLPAFPGIFQLSSKFNWKFKSRSATDPAES